MKFAPKIYEPQTIRKVTHQNGNHHITMCPFIKFQSIWRILDFGTKLAQNYMIDKINNKIVISIQECTPVRIFSQLVELQIKEPNFPKK